jgi:ribulose-5-phosphate 4-epimerase/fuculose-1-phosphate aldolase
MSDELERLLRGGVGEPLTVANEFTEVVVRRVDTRNGSRLPRRTAMTYLGEQRELVAHAGRVAAARGLVEGILGHLSLRVDDERLLVRCRSDGDTGVAFTRPSDIRLIRFDGSAGADGELDGYRVPNELPIHVETMLADSRHRAVAHLHPPAVVAADLAGIQIRPIYGAHDIPGAWLARGGVPVTNAPC